MKIRGLIATAAVLAVFAAEWHLFETSVREWVLPTYPRHHDQTRYLVDAYKDDAVIRHLGLWRAFTSNLRIGHPTGSMLSFEAAVLGFRFVEPSRLGALAVIFAHFVLLQIAFLYVAAWATRSRAFGIVAVALLVASGFLFVVPGGLFDFRIDAAASCTFGIFIAALVRSDFYRHRLWSTAAGLVAGYLIALRYNMVFHLAALHLVFLAALWIRGGSERRARMVGFACSLAATVVVSLPFLLFSHAKIAAYYTSQVADRGPIRGALAGRSAFRHWVFYPYNVLVQHIRFMPVVAALSLFLPWSMRRAGASLPKPRLGTRILYLPLLASVVVPLLLLTLHTGRSTTVDGLVLPPIVLLATFAIADLTRRWAPANTLPAPRSTTLVAALAVLVGALAIHALQHRLWRLDERRIFDDGVAVLDMHYEIAKAAVARRWISPAFVTNSLEDELDPNIGATALFERDRGLLIPRQPALRDQMFPVPERRFWRTVRSSDVALLQTRGERIAYPAVRFAQSIEKELFAEVRDRLDEIGGWSFSDSAVEAYIAPPTGGS